MVHAHQPKPMQVTNNDMQRVVAGFLLAALATVSSSSAATGGSAFRMQLSHIDAAGGLTRRELAQRMAARSKTRAARLLSGSWSANLSAVPGVDTASPQAEYLVSFAIGTPPQPVKMNLDTGSDLVWTQCLPCPACYDQAPLPYFNTSRSSTFTVVPCASPACRQLPWPSCGGARGWGNGTCVYTYSYGDRAVTNGALAADTFTFAGEAAGGAGGGVAGRLAFGCGLFNQGTTLDVNLTGTGIAGFGRGGLSLPSQLKVDNFSYCFTNSTGSSTSSSPVLLGLPANIYGSGGAAVQTTRLIHSKFHPTFYYLRLKSITVGSTRLKAPESAFALKRDGAGGTVIDSGTSFTSLPPRVYRLLRDALVSELKTTPMTTTAFGSSLLCFPKKKKKKTTTAPRLVLHLEGAALDLPPENYVFEVVDGGRRVMCIAVTSGGDMTIIGNYQQQNMHVLYDLAGNTLSFVPAQCDMV